MMGKGPSEVISDLKARAGSNNEEWLSITGARPYHEVISAMLSCSVFVLPTYIEGFPNVIIESMACGCPIVTTDVGAIPELLDLDNNNGILVKPKQVKELRDAIIRLLNDKQYAAFCGRNAQRRVNEFYSMSKVWEQLVNIWQEVAQ